MRPDTRLAPTPHPARVAWMRQWTYAHRGVHGAAASENSPAAFAAAVAAGLGIECDVHRSRDGRAIVFHDRQLDRLTAARGPVAALSAAELAELELPAGGTIPTLRRLLDAVRGRVPVLIELKTTRERPAWPLCRAVLRELEGYRGLHAVMSFDPRVSHWFAGHSPATVRGLVISEGKARPWARTIRRRLALWRARPQFLALDVRDLPSPFAALQRARGIPLLAWTVNDAGTADRSARHADASIAEREGLAAACERRPPSRPPG